MSLWRRVKRTDQAAIALADRHYSRQKRGAQLGQNCRTRCFMTEDDLALWVSLWPKPEYAFHGFGDAYVCSLFRNEGPLLSSTLIVAAVDMTIGEWGPPPSGGFITFVDASKVRRKRDPGRCFLRAGWEYAGASKTGLLLLRWWPDETTRGA